MNTLYVINIIVVILAITLTLLEILNDKKGR